MRLSKELLTAIEHYLNQTATSEEIQLVNTWYHSFNDSRLVINTVEQDLKNKIDALLRARLAETTGVQQIKSFPVKKLVNPAFKWLAAAMILMVAGTGLYFYAANTGWLSGSGAYANDIPPGKNLAILTLANGKKIVLSDAVNGQLAQQSGVKITKTSDGQLIYTVIDDPDKLADNNPEINTIETPNGGKYIVNLPDGTKVWINAASTIRFPTRFTGKERMVELSGEAYFEVAKVTANVPKEIGPRRIPFIVKTAKEVVEVLGTHFNINSYPDDAVVKTTLLEGSVKVWRVSGGLGASLPGGAASASRKNDKESTAFRNNNTGVVLEPGQQAVLEQEGLTIKDADLSVEMAWKNGEFIFASNDFRSEMRKVARWYDVDVVYDPSVPVDFELGGFISREKNISAVLKLIELTGDVRFKIEGRRILVTK